MSPIVAKTDFELLSRFSLLMLGYQIVPPCSPHLLTFRTRVGDRRTGEEHCAASSYVNLAHSLELSERREHQLRNCLQKVWLVLN